jgi:MFS family permease
VDRLRRRPVLVVSDLARAALTLVIVLFAFTDTLTLPILVVLVVVIGCFTVSFEVSYQSYLPAVVARSELERANGRLQATAAATEVGGPGIGGLLIQALSAPFAERAPTRTGGSALHDLANGLAFVRRDPYLVSLVGFAAIYNLFAQWIMVLFTVHAVRELGLTAGHLGVIFSLGAIGAVCGAALAPASVRRLGAGRVLIACAAVECVALAALPVVDRSWGTPVIVSALIGVFAANGAGTSLSSVVALTLRQLRTPDHVLGRVNATMRWISYGVIAIGAGIGGVVGELIGTRMGLALGCAGTFLTVVWVSASPLRRIIDPQLVTVHAAPTDTRPAPG